MAAIIAHSDAPASLARRTAAPGRRARGVEWGSRLASMALSHGASRGVISALPVRRAPRDWRRNRAMIESSPMEIVINGESRSFPAALSVADLVETLGFAGKRIAVERNGDIVPRSQHGATQLVDGDRLEIVVAVGGG